MSFRAYFNSVRAICWNDACRSGAEVIKVEPPGIGDLARFMGTTKNGMGHVLHSQ